MTTLELKNPITENHWCIVKDHVISLNIDRRELLDVLTEWKNSEGAEYPITFQIHRNSGSSLAFCHELVIVFLPCPDADSSKPYHFERSWIIPTSEESRFLEVLKRVDAYINAKLEKLSGFPCAALREVSPGVAEIVPKYRGIEHWTLISNASPRYGARVSMDEKATSPYFKKGVFYVPTDFEARRIPFQLERASMNAVNVGFISLSGWHKDNLQKRANLLALVKDREFVNSCPTAEHHLLNALRAIMRP